MEKGTYIFNHIQLMIWYHGSQEDGGHIVKASIALASCKDFPCSGESKPLKIPPFKRDSKNKFDIQYSYSVVFIVSLPMILTILCINNFTQRNDNIKWASRWDYILDNPSQSSVQWFSLINSVLITVFLSAMVGMILLRSLYRDLARYNKTDNMVSHCLFIANFLSLGGHARRFWLEVSSW